MLEIIKVQHNTPEWLAMRNTGIGGSDAAAILGLSPWKSNVDVWEEKVGLREPVDLDDNDAVKYGKEAEDLLIKLFALDFPQYKVNVDKTVVYRRGFMFASLDGELTDEQGCNGILEVKTTEIHSARAAAKWDEQVPQYYYVQLLHYLITTGWSFAILTAQIKDTGRNGLPRATTERYPYYRKDLSVDMAYLYRKEKEFWGYVERKERPPLLLPNI